MTELPTLWSNSILGYISTIFGTIFIILWFFQRRKMTEIADLRTSNDTLRKLVGDQTTEVSFLRRDVMELKKQHEDNLTRISSLEGVNHSLKSLVEDALVSYFKTYPTIAKEISDNVIVKKK